MRLLLILLFGLASMAMADEKGPEEKSWWEKRQQQTPGLHFPHNAHEQALEKAGLPCLACHPFNKSDEFDPKQVRALAVIANEPLEAICHSCHVVDRSGPTECRLCHPEPETIWPQDHNFDYLAQHGPDAKQDETPCKVCHLDLDDCISCHFRRDGGGEPQHMVGFRYAHGLEARLTPTACGRCHNAGYCMDCHQQAWR